MYKKEEKGNKQGRSYYSKGITLIALVITIVILIILATVTVNVAFGDGGLIDQARQATEKTTNSIYGEETYFANLTAYLKKELEGNSSSDNNECIHTYGEWTIVKEATCLEAGSKTKECSNCGNIEIEEITATGHNYSNGTCIKCGVTCSPHVYGDWEVVKEATCLEAGSKTKECSNCGNVEIEEMTATGHYYSDGTCMKCGATCTNHVYGEWTIVKEATCTSSGSQTRVCSVCGTTETETIVATKHKYGDWITTKRGNCTEEGQERRTCSVCGNSQTRTTSPVPVHSFSNGWCVRCGVADWFADGDPSNDK